MHHFLGWLERCGAPSWGRAGFLCGSLVLALLVVFSFPQRGVAGPTNAVPTRKGPASNQAGNPGNKPRPSYIIAPRDVIEFKVFQEEDLVARVRVSNEGDVVLPLIGSIPIGGKTVEQASEAIRLALDKDFLVNPVVSLTVAEYSKQKFMVLGQVQRPGIYEFSGEEPMTLLQAIALAGGYTRMASTRKVTLKRTVNGEVKNYELKEEADPQGAKAGQFEVLPGDTIHVGARIF